MKSPTVSLLTHWRGPHLCRHCSNACTNDKRFHSFKPRQASFISWFGVWTLFHPDSSDNHCLQCSFKH